MIPELLGWDLADPMWRQKHAALEVATRIIAVSQNTARDLLRLTGKEAVVAHPGVDTSVFKPDPSATPKHWLLIQCSQGTYKRHELFFEAYQQWSYKPFPVLCTDGSFVPETYRQAAAPQPVFSARLDLQGMVHAYQNAVALVYPSAYEGFGLPVLEAMACGTPVIIYPNSALVEAGGDAAFYVEDSLADTMAQVLDPKLRAEKISKGLEWVKSFTWERMARAVQEVLHSAVRR
jgi:glycosyltransferase involved in cell wall biosynthesis